jgi:hypothetical protein
MSTYRRGGSRRSHEIDTPGRGRQGTRAGGRGRCFNAQGVSERVHGVRGGGVCISIVGIIIIITCGVSRMSVCSGMASVGACSHARPHGRQ